MSDLAGQAGKASYFRSLHVAGAAFLLPNPFDAGSARLLARLGFPALATTSAGHAFSTGRRDGGVERNEVMAHIRRMVDAVDLPVSADLGRGFGDKPEDAAEAIRQAAAAGAVGGSIEDATGRPERPLFDIQEAADRVRAAAKAARSLDFDFVLTARAETMLVGSGDLEETIGRLQAYQEAGADVLFAPGLADAEQIATVVTAVDRPVSVLMGLAGANLSVEALRSLGVARVSVGSALARAAYAAILRAAREMVVNGSFLFARDAIPFREIDAMMAAAEGAQ
jgi:2-methylisocitrate lyase-like PEP mutase family enzyme